jgi:hypothetical protein
VARAARRRRPRASSSRAAGTVVLFDPTRHAGPSVAGDPDDLALDAVRLAAPTGPRCAAAGLAFRLPGG